MGPASSTNASARQAIHPARSDRPPQVAASRAFDVDEDEFRLNLSDIPKWRESLDVEGLRPSLLSRLFDLVAPLKR
jgi:hypothetical protein